MGIDYGRAKTYTVGTWLEVWMENYIFFSENCAALKALFRVVETGEFFNRLRNGHLEKSAVTGICRAWRSPKIAKMPLKVHLRLRPFILLYYRTAFTARKTLL